MERVTRTRVAEQTSDAAAWRMSVRTPDASLAADVTRFNAYVERGAPLSRRELPSGQATLVVNLGADLGVAFPGEDRQTFRSSSAFFTGLGSRYAVTETDGGQEGAQVMLTALGARRLLGIPLEEVGDRLIDPIDLFGATARHLNERLRAANSHEHRLTILEAAIRDLIVPSAALPGDLVWALGQILRAKGKRSIAGLATEIGCSRKHLTARFRREFGMPPKALARVLRFSAAIEALRGGRIASWAELAADLGYADQSHLSRDFVAFAGAPPAAFAARMIPGGTGFRA